MLTVSDLQKRFKVSRTTIADWYARSVLPDGISIGGEIRWRETDVRRFEAYLRKRLRCRERGINPDSTAGPAPPVYSTGCKTFDPRAATARMAERERQSRSRTLAAGTAPLPAEKPVTLPDVPEPKTHLENQGH